MIIWLQKSKFVISEYIYSIVNYVIQKDERSEGNRVNNILFKDKYIHLYK